MSETHPLVEQLPHEAEHSLAAYRNAGTELTQRLPYITRKTRDRATGAPQSGALKTVKLWWRMIKERWNWTDETFGFMLAVLALGVIVGMLSGYSGKRLPEWPSLVSINSLISIFTSIMKSSMLLPIAEGISELKWIWFERRQHLTDMDKFDSASRGPWGSFLLLFKTIRRNYLATFGALVMVVAMAIDPFTQQVIQYRDCLEPSRDQTATISRTNTYSRVGVHTGASENVLDAPMTAALYLGLLDPPTNASQMTRFECQSGNCAFEDTTYTSLAMCASVEDISHLIEAKTGDFRITSPCRQVCRHPRIQCSRRQGPTLIGGTKKIPPCLHLMQLQSI